MDNHCQPSQKKLNPMKILTCFLIISILLVVPYSTLAVADPSTDGSDIPADQWYTDASSGIAVNIQLYVENTEDHKHVKMQLNHLLIYIKNISTTGRNIVLGGVDDGFEFFYMDASNVRRDLHNYALMPNPGRVVNGILPPGKVYMHKIEISTKDVPFLTANPIQCSFSVGDSTGTQQYTITTSPKTFSLPQ